jgi:hypothetical protein
MYYTPKIPRLKTGIPTFNPKALNANAHDNITFCSPNSLMEFWVSFCLFTLLTQHNTLFSIPHVDPETPLYI